jgi:hypothetical protein
MGGFFRGRNSIHVDGGPGVFCDWMCNEKNGLYSYP